MGVGVAKAQQLRKITWKWDASACDVSQDLSGTERINELGLQYFSQEVAADLAMFPTFTSTRAVHR